MKSLRKPLALSVLLALALLIGLPCRAAQVIPVTVFDQKVAEVNGEAVSKRDVEEKMPGALQLNAFMKEKKIAGQWDAKMESEWMSMYVPAFKDALRKTIRERLMIQYFKFEKMTLDDRDFQKRVSQAIEGLRKDPDYKTVFTLPDIERRIRDAMMIEEYQSTKFYSPLDVPKRPDVEQEYRDHIDKYQRKAGVKVRIIRIDRAVTDKYTGVKKIRDNPSGYIEEIRNNIVQFGASFAEEARTKSDDESRVRGGLLLGENDDPYIVPESANAVIRAAISRQKNGEVSEVLPYGSDAYVLVTVEDRREAGPAPLEGKLFDEILRKLSKNRTLKREDEWLRATLAKSQIINATENQVLDIDFFFPDDKKKRPDFEANKKP